MVGERLAELRIKKNMTQEEFADYMGVTRQSVSKWELNKAFPDVEKVIRISELYDVSIDYILKGERNDINIAIADTEVKEKEACKEEELITVKSRKRTGLAISTVITAILSAVMLVILIVCVTQHNLGLGEDMRNGVRVEKVYQQLSLVELGFYNSTGEYISETMLVDNQGIRQGDYIYGYVNGGNISTRYKVGTIVSGLMILILMIVMLLLQVKELRRHEQ